MCPSEVWWLGSVLVFLAAALALCVVIHQRLGRFGRMASAGASYVVSHRSHVAQNFRTARGTRGCRLFVLGDSIAASFGSDDALSRGLRDATGCTVTTYGIQGLTSRGVRRLQEGVQSPEFRAADTVIVSLGANDGIKMHKSEALHEMALRSSIRGALRWINSNMDRRRQRLVWSMFPKEAGKLSSLRFFGPGEAMMGRVWGVVKDELDQTGAETYVFPRWWWKQMVSDPGNIGPDGLHPSAQGYGLLARNWAKLLSGEREE
jgi:lysophospholipase L1-like esterase